MIVLEWNQLEYFKTVAELQNFTRAAEQLSISQPALSRSIARLEAELGIALFDRQNKHISLNRYGRIFLRRVNKATQEITLARQELQTLLHPERGTVTVAFLHSLGIHFVPDLLSRFRQLHPSIQFKLYQNATHVLLQQLAAGEVDLCFSASLITKHPIVWHALFDEPLFIALPADHPLAHYSMLSLAQIANEPIITLKQHYGLRVMTEQLFMLAGIEPIITFEGEDIMTIAGLVEARLGVAIIPCIPHLEQAQLAFIPIASPSCHRTIGVSWSQNHDLPAPALIFKDFVINCFS